MRILYLSESDEGGGGMKAAWRLLCAVRELGHEVRMVARDPRGADPALSGPRSRPGRLWMRVRRRLDQWPVHRHRARQPVMFSTAWLPDGLAPAIRAWRPDVVHAHWIANGFLGLGTLARLGAPLVWTAHDSWALTGGCHYHVACERFQQRCGACPALGSTTDDDLSRHGWERKQRAYTAARPTIVAPSTWMAGRVQRSALCAELPCTVIRNGIDRALFTPGDRTAARVRWNLPVDRRLVLFAALHHDDHNKGLHLLLPALRAAAAADPRIELVAVGNPPKAGMPDVGTRVHAIPALTADRDMAALLQAVDVVTVPSLSENLPFTVVEGQACGALPVTFAIGGIPDLVEHRVSGWLAKPYEVDDLAAGLRWACAAAPGAHAAALAASAAMSDAREVARRHLELYTALARPGAVAKPGGG